MAVATGQDIFEGRYVFITDGVMAFYGRQCTAILAESDSLRLISLAASDGNKFSRTATTTRPCAGRRSAPREQLRLSARWMQRRKCGPDCLSAASFRAVRSASYGPLTLLRVAPTACPDKAGFNEPVPLVSVHPQMAIFADFVVGRKF